MTTRTVTGVPKLSRVARTAPLVSGAEVAWSRRPTTKFTVGPSTASIDRLSWGAVFSARKTEDSTNRDCTSRDSANRGYSISRDFANREVILPVESLPTIIIIPVEILPVEFILQIEMLPIEIILPIKVILSAEILPTEIILQPRLPVEMRFCQW